jgi:hypothetical protein
MIAIAVLIVRMLRDCFKPRPRLEAEILILRHQLNVLQRRTPRRRLHLRWIDRALFIWLYRRYPRILDAMSIVRPETVVRWHRKGLARYWRWKSRSPGGRPRIAREVRDLIRRMSFENSLWGASKIHGELLKLGIAVARLITAQGNRTNDTGWLASGLWRSRGMRAESARAMREGIMATVVTVYFATNRQHVVSTLSLTNRRRKSEHLVLPRPLGGHVGEAGHSHAMR